MGVIKRQGLKQSIVIYLGALMGIINVTFVYPLCFEKEELGLVQYLINTSLFLMNFIFLGTNYLPVRFFQYFKNEDGSNNGFLFFITKWASIGIGISFLIALPFYGKIVDYFELKYGDKSIYLVWLVPILLCLSYFNLFIQFCINFKRIVVTSILDQLIKFTLPLLAVLFYLNYINLNHVSIGILATYFICLIGIMLYIRSLGMLKFVKSNVVLTKEQKKEMVSFVFFSFLMSIAWSFSTRLDTVIVPTLINFSESSVYNIALAIAGLISIPSDSLNQISTAVITDKWQSNEVSEIDKIYKKSSILLLSIGLLFLVGLSICVVDLFGLMPNGNKFIAGVDIIIVLGLAKVVDMMTSVNNPIIQYSSKYKFLMIAFSIYGLSNFLSCILLIPRFGIIGAAYSALISVSLFNLAKLIFIYFHWKIQPFTFSTVKVIALAALVYFLGRYLPNVDNHLINLVVKATIILFTFVSGLLLLNISEEINILFDQFLKIIKIKK